MKTGCRLIVVMEARPGKTPKTTVSSPVLLRMRQSAAAKDRQLDVADICETPGEALTPNPGHVFSLGQSDMSPGTPDSEGRCGEPQGGCGAHTYSNPYRTCGTVERGPLIPTGRGRGGSLSSGSDQRGRCATHRRGLDSPIVRRVGLRAAQPRMRTLQGVSWRLLFDVDLFRDLE